MIFVRDIDGEIVQGVERFFETDLLVDKLEINSPESNWSQHRDAISGVTGTRCLASARAPNFLTSGLKGFYTSPMNGDE